MKKATSFIAVAVVCVAIATLGACETLAAPTWTSWNTNAGLIATKVSYATYCGRSSLQKWNCQWCQDSSIRDIKVKRVFTDYLTNTQGLVGHSVNLRTIFVAFRGTEGANLRNWYTNLRYSKTEPWDIYPSVQVHKGFSKAYKPVRTNMKDALETLMSKYPTYQVVFTGHSLGGALATLALADMGTIHSTKTMHLWTLGSPRVGNGAFGSMISRMRGKSIRMVNQKDVVPSMPPHSFDFTHVAQEVWYTRNNWKVCSSTNGEDGNCSKGQLIALSIEDHLNYFGLHEACGTESMEQIIAREHALQESFEQAGLVAPRMESGPPEMQAPVVNM